MFQFRRFPTYAYFVQRTLTRYCRAGFPHSEIRGSRLMCSSPRLFAACHVLRRLLMPRHSPCALISLIYYSCFSNYAGIPPRFFRNCNCYPFFIKVPQFASFAFLSVALLLLFVQFSRCKSLRVQARMVEISGFEPLTPCLQSRCSPS